MPEIRADWQEVIDMDPRGYLQLNDGERLLHGPIENIRLYLRNSFVEIRLKWSAMAIIGGSDPGHGWRLVKNEPVKFPNGVPFVIDDTMKGKRVRFGDIHILYINECSAEIPSDLIGAA